MTLFHIGFFGWPLYIALCVIYNKIKIDIRGVRPAYFRSNWARCVFGLICLILMTVKDGFDPAYLYTWIPAILPAIYIASSFYLFFDPGLNIARNKDVDYRGKKSGILDPSLSKAMWWTLKGLCLIAMVYSSICIWRGL